MEKIIKKRMENMWHKIQNTIIRVSIPKKILLIVTKKKPDNSRETAISKE